VNVRIENVRYAQESGSVTALSVTAANSQERKSAMLLSSNMNNILIKNVHLLKSTILQKTI